LFGLRARSGSFHSKSKKITVPDDIKGMKFVRPTHHGKFVTQLGGTNVQAEPPKFAIFSKIGVADAVTIPWGSVRCSDRQSHELSHGRFHCM
jgi:hypothetical protein